MKYLLKNLEDLNNVFIINPYQSKYFEGLEDEHEDFRVFNLSFRKYNFPKSEKTIFDCFKFYDEQAAKKEIEKDYDKLIINLSEYGQTLNHAILDFRDLDEKLNKPIFEIELKNVISESQKYFIEEDINHDVLHANTNFQIKHYLSLYLNDLEESIRLIKSLKLNKIQTLVGKEYIISYKKTIDYINKTYFDYIPKVEDESLEKIILHNKINKLLTIESDLIKKGYISKSGSRLYWNPKRGYKVKLVNFCRLLLVKGYIKEYFEIGKVIAYFEDRYNLDTGNQAKPSKFKESDKVIVGDYIFLKF